MAVLEKRPFETLTLKTRCSGHTRCQRSCPIFMELDNNSFGVGFLSIGMTDLELQPFETLILKIWSQGHVGGRRSWPTFMALYSTICLALVSSRLGWRFWRYGPLKLWPWGSGAQVTPEVNCYDLHDLHELWPRNFWRWFRVDLANGSWVMVI